MKECSGMTAVRQLWTAGPCSSKVESHGREISREGKRARNGVNDQLCLCDEATVRIPLVQLLGNFWVGHHMYWVGQKACSGFYMMLRKNPNKLLDQSNVPGGLHIPTPQGQKLLLLGPFPHLTLCISSSGYDLYPL